MARHKIDTDFKLLIATKNPGKFHEIVEVLRVLPVQLLSLGDVKVEEDVEETGKTHEENAILKARFFYEKTRNQFGRPLPTLGEDSGIYVDAFPGDFGVQTRRWKGLGQASDEEWIGRFLAEMREVPEEKRTGRFVCCGAFICDEQSYDNPLIFRGETPGKILTQLQLPLKSGIPLSSCFQPDGVDKVYAALTPEEKNKISHRGKAMRELVAFVQQNLL